MFHASTCITSVAPSVARILGFAPPKCAGDGNPALDQLAADAFSGRKADRALLYNPDAIAHHLFAHYTDLFRAAARAAGSADAVGDAFGHARVFRFDVHRRSAGCPRHSGVCKARADLRYAL